MAKTATQEVVVSPQGSNALVAYNEADDMFAQYAGLGTEDISAADTTIPIIRILSKQSKEVNKRDGKYVPGAEEGMIFNRVTNEIFDGEKQGIVVLACKFIKTWNKWVPNQGGFRGSFHADDPIQHTGRKNEKGVLVLPDGDELIDTANFFCILLHPTDGPQKVLITMTSTQWKKAKLWNTQLRDTKHTLPNGRIIKLPAPASKYLLTTVPERNDQGEWFGWNVKRLGTIDQNNPEEQYAFELGVAFAQEVSAGSVKVDHETDTSSSREADDDIPF